MKKTLKTFLDEIPLYLATSAIYYAIRMMKHQKKIFLENLVAESSIEEKELGEYIIYIITKLEGKLLSDFDNSMINRYTIELSLYIDRRGLKESIATPSKKKDILKQWRNESVHSYDSRTYNRKFKPTIFISSNSNDILSDEIRRFLMELGLDIISSPYFWSEEMKLSSIIEISSLTDLAIFVIPKNSAKFRDNQLFELGYLLGKLGRENVILFSSNSYNIPSDLFGLKYISSDSKNWMYDLAMQIDSAGIEFEKSRIDRNSL